MDKKELLTVPDVMKRLNVSRRTVYYWIDKKILNPIKIGNVYRFRYEQIEMLIEQGVGSPEGEKKDKAKTSQVSRKKILVVDDDLLVRESLKMILEREGYDVKVVSGGQSAVDFVTQEDFDLILTDFKMPHMDGIDTIEAVRGILKRQKRTAIPELLLTAYDDEELHRKAAEMGIEDILHKPFELESFLNTLKDRL